jgi:hypothetical protein
MGKQPRQGVFEESFPLLTDNAWLRAEPVPEFTI